MRGAQRHKEEDDADGARVFCTTDIERVIIFKRMLNDFAQTIQLENSFMFVYAPQLVIPFMYRIVLPRPRGRDEYAENG